MQPWTAGGAARNNRTRKFFAIAAAVTGAVLLRADMAPAHERGELEAATAVGLD